MTTAMTEAEPTAQSGLDCRVHERYECYIEASCKPFVAQASTEMAWTGRICNISIDGLALMLPRRFEPGAGLSIVLPTTDENIPPEVLIVKVLNVDEAPDRQWLLGCQFLSQLGDDHLQSLIDYSLAHETTIRPTNGNGKQSDHFEIILMGPSYRKIRPKLRIREFRSDGEWPLQVDKVMHLRIGDSPRSIGIRVRETLMHRGQWIVRYKFVKTPNMDDLIRFGWRP